MGTLDNKKIELLNKKTLSQKDRFSDLFSRSLKLNLQE